jgi:uncharacterized protein YraI
VIVGLAMVVGIVVAIGFASQTSASTPASNTSESPSYTPAATPIPVAVATPSEPDDASFIAPTPEETATPAPTATPTAFDTYAENLRLAALAAATPPPATYKVAGISANDRLNIRQGPGATYAIVATLRPGLGGITLGRRTTNGGTTWQEISIREYTGWVNADYLAIEEGTFNPSAPAAPTPESDVIVTWNGVPYRMTAEKGRLVQGKINSLAEADSYIDRAYSALQANEIAKKKAGIFGKKKYVTAIAEINNAIEGLKRQRVQLRGEIEQSLGGQ